MSDNRQQQQQQQQQAPPPRVNTAAALLQEIKKEREERLSSSGGSYPHALRGGSGAADVGPSYTKAPVVGFTDHRLPPPDKVTRTQPPSLPWPFNDKARPQSAEGESSADVDTPGGLPALELFSGLHFMKPRVGGGGGAQRSNSRAKPTAGRDTNERGASDEEEESDEGEEEIGEQAVVLRRHHGAKRRQDSSHELALEQHAGASKRLRPAARPKKANLWTLDAHLHYLSIWLEYLNTYKTHIWTISPLDPAALDHNNARHLLCTNEGAEDRSALSLSVNFCLAIGALMHGDEKSHMEFYMRARQHLGYLFDTTDYSVALALIAMSHHTMYWEADAKRSEYYLTLAINIIAQLGAFHSDVYHRCLCMHSLTFRHGSNDLAKMVKLKQELRRAKQMPYYPITQSANSVVSYDMFRHLRFVTGATGIMTSVVAGINLFKAVSPPGSQGSVSPEQQIVFRKLIQALDDLDSEIRSLHGMDAPSPSASLTMLAFITALRAECYMCLGDYKAGLSWANQFLQDSRKPHFRFVIAGVVLMLDMIMGILLRANQFAMLAAQMDAIEHNCVSCPTLDLVKNKYKKHLIEDIQRRQLIADSRTALEDAGTSALQHSQPQRPALVAPLLAKQEPPPPREGGSYAFGEFPAGGQGDSGSGSPLGHTFPASPSSGFPSRSSQWHYYAGEGSGAQPQSSVSAFSPSSMLNSDSATPTPTGAEGNRRAVETPEEYSGGGQMEYQEEEGRRVQQGEADGAAGDHQLDRYEAPSPPPLDDHEYFNGLLNDQDEGLLQQFLDSS